MLLGADYFVSHRVYVSNAQHRLYFTYTGGRLFGTGAHVDATTNVVAQGGAAEAATPTDADGYSRRGAMMQTQRSITLMASSSSPLPPIANNPDVRFLGAKLGAGRDGAAGR